MPRRRLRELLAAKDQVDADEVIMSPEKAKARGLTSTVTFPRGNLAPEGSVIKSTAIVSIIGLSDLMTRGQQAAGTTREPFSFYLAVAVICLVFTSVSELAFSWAQKRLAIGVKEGQL